MFYGWNLQREFNREYDLDDRIVLARKESDPTYEEIVCGAEGMTLVLRLTGGDNAKIQAPFFIFESALGSYPIGGTPDNVYSARSHVYS